MHLTYWGIFDFSDPTIIGGWPRGGGLFADSSMTIGDAAMCARQ
jgi:hypothetical protein